MPRAMPSPRASVSPVPEQAWGGTKARHGVPSRRPHAGPRPCPQLEDACLGGLRVAQGGVLTGGLPPRRLLPPRAQNLPLPASAPPPRQPAPAHSGGPVLACVPGLRGLSFPATPPRGPPHRRPLRVLHEPRPVRGAGLSRGPPGLTPAPGGPPAAPCPALGLGTGEHRTGPRVGRGPQGAALPSAPQGEGELETEPPCPLPWECVMEVRDGTVTTDR